MPWEVTIRGANHKPLGDLAVVRQQIVASLPGIEFHRDPSGLEKIAAARDAGVEFPDIIRQHMEMQPPQEQAEFKGDGFSLVLFGLEAKHLEVIHVEIRGNGNPLSVLADLCQPHGWIAIDDASGQPVDLGGVVDAGWESFRALRDRAINRIQESDSGD
jgi:hypothetical protein